MQNQLNPKLHRPSSRLFLTFSPQRSGQHLIINWLCLGLNNTLHVNHVTQTKKTLLGKNLWSPLKGRTVLYNDQTVVDTGKISPLFLPNLAQSDSHYENELWSFEDTSPSEVIVAASYKIAIIRDPFNWLASTIKHGKWNKAQISVKARKYEKLIEEVNQSVCGNLYKICFDKFVIETSYRAEVSKLFSDHNFQAAEKALKQISDFGGGSSFTGISQSNLTEVTSRWRDLQNNTTFKSIIEENPALFRRGSEE